MARQARRQACNAIQNQFIKVEYPTALVQHIIEYIKLMIFMIKINFNNNSLCAIWDGV
jgi:hypothetical protein